VTVLPSLRSTGLFIGTGAIAGRTDAELARYDQIITNFDHADRIPGTKAINPACRFLNYKNALLCNDWGREGPPPLPTDGHGVGTTGVSHTELVENPDWGLYTMLTETYPNSVGRDTPAVLWECITTGVVVNENASKGDTTRKAYLPEAAGLTIGQPSLTGRAAYKSFDFGTEGIRTDFKLQGEQDYCFEGWAQVDALGSYMALVGSDGTSHRMSVFVRPDGFPSFYSDTNLEGQTWFQDTVPVGTPFHWACNWRHSTLTAEFFINGESMGEVVLAQPISGANVGYLSIGSWHNDYAHYVWNGRLSHIAVYHHVLTERRITAHYVNGPTAAPSGGVLCESGLFPDNYLGRVDHPGYIDRWLSNVRLDIEDSDWDGIMMDDVDDTARFHFGVWIGVPDEPYSPLVDDDLRAMFTTFLTAVYADLSSEFHVWANIANSARPDVWELWLPHLDGGFREFWKKTGTGDSRPLEPPTYPAAVNERYVDAEFPYEDGYFPLANADGKGFCPITYGIAADTTAQLYGYASAMLSYNAALDQYYCFAKGDAVQDSWTVYWTKDIGQPVAPRVEIATNCFTREFTDGIVLVNGSSAAHAFPVSRFSGPGFTRMDGSQAPSSVTLQPGTAEIITGKRLVPDTRRKISLPKKRGTVASRPTYVLES